MRAFNNAAKSRPGPAFTAPVIFQVQMLVLQCNSKPIFKRGRFFINRIRQYEPKSDHQRKPQN